MGLVQVVGEGQDFFGVEGIAELFAFGSVFCFASFEIESDECRQQSLPAAAGIRIVSVHVREEGRVIFDREIHNVHEVVVSLRGKFHSSYSGGMGGFADEVIEDLSINLTVVLVGAADDGLEAHVLEHFGNVFMRSLDGADGDALAHHGVGSRLRPEEGMSSDDIQDFVAQYLLEVELSPQLDRADVYDGCPGIDVVLVFSEGVGHPAHRHGKDYQISAKRVFLLGLGCSNIKRAGFQTVNGQLLGEVAAEFAGSDDGCFQSLTKVRLQS